MTGQEGRVVLVTGAASGIGEAVAAHLLSDDTAYVNGQVLAVDGGATVL